MSQLNTPFHTLINDGIAELIINRPPVNALDSKSQLDLAKEIDRLGTLDEVRVIIIRSEGRGFCAGVDIKELDANPDLIVVVNHANYETFRAVHRNPRPVIVAVHGFVLGGGIGIAGAADILVASECATFGVPEVDRGAMGGAAHLQRMFPVQKVRHMYFTGEAITAAPKPIVCARSKNWCRPRPRCAKPRSTIARKIAAKSPAMIQHRQGIAEWHRGRQPRRQIPLGAGLHLAGLSASRVGRDAPRLRREA
jgi:enoyl-CoA hydratase